MLFSQILLDLSHAAITMGFIVIFWFSLESDSKKITLKADRNLFGTLVGVLITYQVLYVIDALNKEVFSILWSILMLVLLIIKRRNIGKYTLFLLLMMIDTLAYCLLSGGIDYKGFYVMNIFNAVLSYIYFKSNGLDKILVKEVVKK